MMLVQVNRVVERGGQLERLGLRSALGQQREQRAEPLKMRDLARQLGEWIDCVSQACQLEECAQCRHAVVQRVDEPLEQIIGDRRPIVE